jgi:hypothetical protein
MICRCTVGKLDMPQNAIDIELCLHIANGKPACPVYGALAHRIGKVKTGLARCKVLAPLLAATEWNQS